MNEVIDWSVTRNVLCVRPDNIGDVLMTTPAIRALKQQYPFIRVTLLTSTAGQQIARMVPEIDETIRFDPPWYKHENTVSANELNELVSVLSTKNFDLAILFTVFSQNPLPNAMICYMAGIADVAGVCRENPYGLITHWVPDEEPLYHIQHEVRRQVSLMNALGVARPRDVSLSLEVAENLRRAVLRKLAASGIQQGENWLVLHPGASENKRRYPAADFSEAVRSIHRELGYRVVITGSGQEEKLASCVEEMAGGCAVSLAGKLTLEELVALIDLSPLLIANNTGPVHIAAARNTPVVVLYALTNPQHLPWQVPYRALPFDPPGELKSRNVVVRWGCEQAFKVPAGSVNPEEIVSAVAELLSGETSAPDTEILRTPLPTDAARPPVDVRRGVSWR